VPDAFDLDRVLRRLKPEKHTGRIQKRAAAGLPFAENESPAGPPLMLDTCVYLHVLRGKTPITVDNLLRTRTLYHSATVVAELTNRFGARIPANEKEKAARKELADTIRDMPAHRMVVPTMANWGEAGVLVGLRARLGGFNQDQSQDALNDALLLLQARDAGAALLTENISDFDILQQLVPNGRVLFYRTVS
jgi:predicted nucleic acid-binding protein